MKIALKSLAEAISYVEPADIALVLENPEAFAAVMVALACPPSSRDNPLGQQQIDVRDVGSALMHLERGREASDMLLKIAVAAR